MTTHDITLYPSPPQHRTGNIRIVMRYLTEHDRLIAHIWLDGAYRTARTAGLSPSVARHVILNGVRAASGSTTETVYAPVGDDE